MKNTNWNTYRTTCCTHDVAQDQRSAGGVHLHQVRLSRGGWQARIKQSNGRFASYGATRPVSAAEGTAYYGTAKTA